MRLYAIHLHKKTIGPRAYLPSVQEKIKKKGMVMIREIKNTHAV